VLNGVGSEVSVPTTITYLMPHKHELQAIQDSRHHRHAINGQIRVTDRLQHRSETDKPSLGRFSEACAKS
jgi:hypothetical protein